MSAFDDLSFNARFAIAVAVVCAVCATVVALLLDYFDVLFR